ncbi:MAG TPA: hypothetical protein PKK06_08420 [Phycisphaerae bacterium]|nr:hypothetical protein [Phycisphaerae bacterium]HNU45266.1 hypothetical protein [Phycisphaerae bacterium]
MRLAAACFGLVLVVGLTGVPGCGQAFYDLIAGQFHVDFPEYALIGEDDAGRALLAVRQEPFSLEGDDPVYDIFALDLATLTAEKLTGDIQTAASLLRATGASVVWADWSDGTVTLRDLQAGADRVVLPGVEGAGGQVAPVALDDARLVAHRPVDLTGAASPATYELVVIDLATDAQTVLPDSWLYATVAVSGDYLALMNDADGNARLLGLELGADLEIVNLTTGAREKIASNIRVSGDGGELFAGAGRFVWQQFKSGGFDTVLRSYDPLTQELRTLADPLNDATGVAWVVDVRGDQMLIERVYGSLLSTETTAYELRAFDGRSAAVVQFSRGLFQQQAYQPSPRFAAGYVIWTDPDDGRLTIFEPATRTTRHFDPRTLSDADN